MAKMPVFNDDDFDDDIIQQTPPVPKGWAVDTDEDDNEDENTPENAVPAVAQRDNGDEGITTTPERPATLKSPPRRRAFVEEFDDEDEETAPVVQAKSKRRSFVEDFDEPETHKVTIDGDGRIHAAPKQQIVEDFDEDADDDDTVTIDEDTGELKRAAPVAATGGVNAETAAQPVQHEAEPKAEPVVPVKRLSERAMLVSLNISQWGGRRFDRAVSDEVNARKAASANAGRYNKVLLPDCAELAEIHRQTSSLRNWFVEQTSPWLNDGARIMPSARYLDFNQEFRKRQNQWIVAVDALIQAYPGLLARAPSQLQTMYDPSDYPTIHELRAKFAMDVRVLPLPDKADFRVELDDTTMEAIKAGMASQEADIAKGVVTDCWQRLHKVVAAMADRLSDPDAIFRNSLTDNLSETVDILKDLNITGDPELDRVRIEVKQTLCKHTADNLRINMRDRKEAAVKAKAVADDIVKRMGTLMGSTQC